jgi:hypothetical protein
MLDRDRERDQFNRQRNDRARDGVRTGLVRIGSRQQCRRGTSCVDREEIPREELYRMVFGRRTGPLGDRGGPV